MNEHLQNMFCYDRLLNIQHILDLKWFVLLLVLYNDLFMHGTHVEG